MFIQCSYVDENGTATDKQCTREKGHEGLHSIPIRIDSGKARKQVSDDLQRQALQQSITSTLAKHEKGIW